jgi:hypothetical protein
MMHPAPIITLRQIEHLTRIRDVLRDNTHNGFPVVRARSPPNPSANLSPNQPTNQHPQRLPGGART